jgi:hypothetical protein
MLRIVQLCIKGVNLLKSRKKIIIFLVIIAVFVGTYLFRHSTPERLVRSNLFFKGYFISAFTTDIYKAEIDSQYGQFYACKNPAIGPDRYAFIKENGLWYINWNGTGGG